MPTKSAMSGIAPKAKNCHQPVSRSTITNMAAASSTPASAP